tara:strand:- start:540 stop:743 length:204 start_codon:yes stop_codon:yes gene_type:complete
MKYTVLVREVHISHIAVEAESEAAALEQVNAFGSDAGEGEIYCEYSHTLDTDTWTVEKTNEGKATDG